MIVVGRLQPREVEVGQPQRTAVLDFVAAAAAMTAAAAAMTDAAAAMTDVSFDELSLCPVATVKIFGDSTGQRYESPGSHVRCVPCCWPCF